MYFHDVSPGDSWKAESAARYNAVNALLSRADFQTALPPEGSVTGRILVRNASNAALEIFTAVSPQWPLQGTPADFSPEERAWNVLPARNEDSWWAVLQQKLAPQQCGEAVICGVTLAKLADGAEPGECRCIAPGANGLEYRTSGRGELLGVLEDDAFALICLRGASYAGYDGVFKLTARPRTQGGSFVNVGPGFLMMNGELRSFNGENDVACEENGYLYLCASARTAGVWIDFCPINGSGAPVPDWPQGSREPGEEYGIFLLGKIVSGVVTQLCRSIPQIIVLGEDCAE